MSLEPGTSPGTPDSPKKPIFKPSNQPQIVGHYHAPSPRPPFHRYGQRWLPLSWGRLNLSRVEYIRLDWEKEKPVRAVVMMGSGNTVYLHDGDLEMVKKWMEETER